MSKFSREPNAIRAITSIRVAGGEGFEPPTAGSGGLCPVLTRLPALVFRESVSMYKLGQRQLIPNTFDSLNVALELLALIEPVLRTTFH